VTNLFRLGLVGGGRMGQTHIRALEPSSTVQIVAAAEPLEATAVKLRDLGLQDSGHGVIIHAWSGTRFNLVT